VRRRGTAGPTGPPDFVGVGAFRSATRGWFGLLREHPGILGDDARDEHEHFFDEFCARAMTDEDIARYHERFRRRPGVIRGEWRPRYMYAPWTPPLLARAAPDARLLVLVGDPIARYRRTLGAGDFLQLAEDEIYMADVIGRARYATQLRRLHAHFDAERILVLQHERCRLDPVGEYRRTLRFLGVDADWLPRRLSAWRPGSDDRDLRFPTRLQTAKRRLVQSVRRTRDPEPAALWPDLEAALHEELDPEVAGLCDLVPGIDLSLWPHFAGLRAAAGSPSP
jgi:hypothetical protein